MRLLTTLGLIGSAAFAETTAPDPVELVRRSVPAVLANSEKTQLYAYREYRVEREHDKNGKETERKTYTWDVIGLEGSTYRKLIQRNDQPLAPKEQKREDERLVKETARRRKETPEQRRNRVLSFSYSLTFRYERMTDLFDLEYKGEEAVEGRTAYVVQGMPKPGVRPANDNEKELLNYRVRVWIDQEELTTPRIEFEVIGDHSRMQKGSMFDWSSERDEAGVWLLKELRIRYNIRFFKALAAHGEVTETYSDYKRFQVDSRLLEGQN